MKLLFFLQFLLLKSIFLGWRLGGQLPEAIFSIQRLGQCYIKVRTALWTTLCHMLIQLCLWACDCGRCCGIYYLHVLSVDGIEGLVPMNHSTKHQRLQKRHKKLGILVHLTITESFPWTSVKIAVGMKAIRCRSDSIG